MTNFIHHDRRGSAVLAILAVVVFEAVLLNSGSAQQANPNPAPGSGAAANTPARTLSLAQAREIAFERNWDLLAAKSGIDAATAQLIVAK